MLNINEHISIQKMQSPLFNGINVHVLRLDEIHAIVSGNKWFKLQYYLKQALEKNYTTVATFGGAYSNHIVATAFASAAFGLKSIGIIRGEAPKIFSATLNAAKAFGMELHFVSRTEFENKEHIQQTFNQNYYWINEGGYGIIGMQGASDILKNYATQNFTHIVSSCGTGTMLAGLINAALPHQQIVGICALKGYENIENDIRKILPMAKQEFPFTIFHNYHFGGYAKHPKELIEWMNTLWKQEAVPSDIVYTSKLFYAVHDLCCTNYFSTNDTVLIIHSGGLQGNLSLPINTLSF
ncbi:MAG TPA: pyridoxal-phosphate dependent enzyme [Chitinophagaceae bacterium]|jgi:1-aminocyclopropane-1-carboxylate deaminase|nr:pyridoxal-phosphate dependent enzyme [Chitinophagaceae bacterium]